MPNSTLGKGLFDFFILHATKPTDTLEMMWLTVDGLTNTDRQTPITALTDDEVLALLNAKMDG
jgi:hypothetical protein